jgi:hypothetical protein
MIVGNKKCLHYAFLINLILSYLNFLFKIHI